MKLKYIIIKNENFVEKIIIDNDIILFQTSIKSKLKL